MSQKEIIVIVAIILVFALSAYLSSEFTESINMAVGNYGFWGLILYLLATILSVAVLPIAALPLLPVAVAVWGPLVVALLSIAGWTTGSLIAFVLARRYGKPLTAKFINLEKVEKFEGMVSGKNIFWSMVALRMALPVDVLSYALGLFSSMTLNRYFLATLIGVSPFAFIFSYAAVLPAWYQISAVSLALIAVGLMYYKIKKHMEAKPS